MIRKTFNPMVVLILAVTIVNAGMLAVSWHRFSNRPTVGTTSPPPVQRPIEDVSSYANIIERKPGITTFDAVCVTTFKDGDDSERRIIGRFTIHGTVGEDFGFSSADCPIEK